MRKILGSTALVVWLIGYVLTAAVVGDRVLDEHWAVQMLFFPIAGLAWVIPLRPLLRWMHANDAPTEKVDV
jgi:membrane protein implicated in regulation of membrane protease activity